MRPLIRSCFLLLVLGRLFLLALPILLGICLRSRWSPPFPLHDLALIPLSLAKVRLSPTLTLSPLMIWCFGHSAQFPFLLARATAAFLATALFVATDSRSVLAALSSPPSFLLSQTLWQIWQELSSLSCSIRLQSVPDTRFSRGTTRPMSWPDGVRYLRPPLSLVVSLLLPLVSTLVLSRTGGVLFHRSSLTHRLPRFPPRNLCSLVMLAVFSLVFAATDTAFF